MIRVILIAAMALFCGDASAECFGGRCAISRVVTAPVRVVAPVARAVVAAPVVAVDRVAPVVSAIVTAPVRVAERIADNSAQRHAERLAATGAFSHCPDRGGAPYEGLGFSSSSPDDACRRACFWGRRPVREIGTAWCPHRRGWVAVVRYN